MVVEKAVRGNDFIALVPVPVQRTNLTARVDTVQQGTADGESVYLATVFRNSFENLT